MTNSEVKLGRKIPKSHNQCNYLCIQVLVFDMILALTKLEILILNVDFKIIF